MDPRYNRWHSNHPTRCASVAADGQNYWNYRVSSQIDPKIYLIILSSIIIQGSITAWIRHYSTSLSRVEKRGPCKRGFECFCKDLPAKDGGERRDWDSHIFIFISILRFFPVIILLILRLLALSSLLDDSLLEALSLSTIVWKHQLRKATCQPNMTYLNFKGIYWHGISMFLRKSHR